MEEDIYSRLEDVWSLEDNKDMYLGFNAAAVPEGAQEFSELAIEGSPSVWSALTDYGIDKPIHGAFSYFGAKSVMKAWETAPFYLMDLFEDREGLTADIGYATGEKLADPTFQQKAAAGLFAVAALGAAKEFSDAYFDPLDYAFNMGGASTAVLDEYGDGGVRRGGKRLKEDMQQYLEDEKELDSEILENAEALGKI